MIGLWLIIGFAVGIVFAAGLQGYNSYCDRRDEERAHGPERFAFAVAHARQLAEGIEIPPGKYLVLFENTDIGLSDTYPRAYVLNSIDDVAAAMTTLTTDDNVYAIDSNRDLICDNWRGQWFPYEARDPRRWRVRPAHVHEQTIARHAAETISLDSRDGS